MVPPALQAWRRQLPGRRAADTLFFTASWLLATSGRRRPYALSRTLDLWISSAEEKLANGHGTRRVFRGRVTSVRDLSPQVPP